MSQSETEYLPERWGPEWMAQMKSFTAKLPTVTKENAEQFIREHYLVFRDWDEPLTGAEVAWAKTDARA